MRHADGVARPAHTASRSCTVSHISKPGANSYLVLAAMVFAVAMTFIDQTIVAIAVPDLQKDLSLSATGSQWIINGYLLALAALFAFGGRLGDVLGRRRMVVYGVCGFALASALCGLTPTSGIGEAWIIFFRVLQGASAALMFPAAVGIVAASFPQAERGKAMAIFFGISGGLTAVGPIAGGYLTQWTWRSIFWINVPVAIIALILIWRSKPDNERRPAPLDYRGTVLVTGAIGLTVLGLQQSSVWGWSSIATWLCVAAGVALGVAFVLWELRTPTPLLRLQIFKDRGFAVDNAVLGLLSVVFVPFFFFASVYAQAALGESSSNAGVYLLYFFIGFVIASQIGGRILDQRGARPTVILGAALGAVGFYLLAHQLTDLSLSSQKLYIILSGGGLGFILGPASTDAVNRAPSTSYGEVTGITQTARNLGAGLGLAVLGSILVSHNRTNVTSALTQHGVPHGVADRIAASLGTASVGSSGSGAREPASVVHDVQLAFAQSTQTVFYVMAAVLAVTFVVALLWLPRGRPALPDAPDAEELSSTRDYV
jgi:EmrB/QacA subfamily drug resistance transporter